MQLRGRGVVETSFSEQEGLGLLQPGLPQPAGDRRHRRTCTTSVQTHLWQRGACLSRCNVRASRERGILLKVFRIYVGV